MPSLVLGAAKRPVGSKREARGRMPVTRYPEPKGRKRQVKSPADRTGGACAKGRRTGYLSMKLQRIPAQVADPITPEELQAMAVMRR